MIFGDLKTDADREVARLQYEGWIRAARARARRERFWTGVRTVVGIAMIVTAILMLLVWAEYATAKPLEPQPKIDQAQPLEQFSPHSGRSLAEAKQRCESAGGYWLVDEKIPEQPNGKIVGCLWLVPKGAK